MAIKKAKERKIAPIAIRITPSIKDAISKAAEDESRSLSAMVQILLEEALKERGYLK